MAGFFDDLKKGINKVTTKASTNASTMIEVNKLKSEITAAGREKKVVFGEIGQAIYDMKKDGEIDLSQVDVLLSKVFDLDAKVVELEGEIEKVNQEKNDKLNALEETEVVSQPVEATPTQATQAEPVVQDVAEVVAEPVVEVVEEVKSEDKSGDMGGDTETGEYHG